MSKGTQLWPGQRMRAFFRSHIRRETDLDEAATERLTTALEKATNRMLVWAEATEVDEDNKPDQSKSARSWRSAARSETADETIKSFDPYAFSLMVVLARSGRDGLAKRLQEITDIKHLRAISEAQHLAIDKEIKKITDYREAMVEAAEQRLADRKAAAS